VAQPYRPFQPTILSLSLPLGHIACSQVMPVSELQRGGSQTCWPPSLFAEARMRGGKKINPRTTGEWIVSSEYAALCPSSETWHWMQARRGGDKVELSDRTLKKKSPPSSSSQVICVTGTPSASRSLTPPSHPLPSFLPTTYIERLTSSTY